LPKPFGWWRQTEFRSTAVLLRVEAFRKTTRTKYSAVSLVSASITRTPAARPESSSQMRLWAIEKGRSVMRPVAAAAGNVEELLEK
jgi:hypothetical protein